MENLAYLKKSKQNKFDWKVDTSIENEEEKLTLDLLSVIYDFEEKKETFLSAFILALIIFC